MKNSSHTSVQQFKTFIHEHPLLIKKVREGELNLQETYEKYVLLGEDDPTWEKYKKNGEVKAEESTSSSQLYQKLWKHIEHLDVNQVENHINDLNGAIGNILTLIDQFKQFRSNQISSSPSDQMFNRPKD
ncbi:spore coat protein YlbD [Gracilibacillus kekensis]|uniref:Putative coat protein n=1 Tax=Gracilibacillus kekensis TaxID=1027249 RepID=A0A1M7M9U8_9BACI|nr:spore coat protein YlbD [Gracilibacillus kekensis]SHM87571.1 Putative coat protein [Gracilibacillus kekensis]